jgi:glycosyltransferase involved in cell wall biosynthesis
VRVAAYTHLDRTRNPTGVGNHLIQMVQGLWRAAGVEVTVIAPRSQLDEAGRIPPQNPLAGIPARGLPLGRRWLEAMWERLDAPKLDYWCPRADWVYTPTEAYIAVRRPRLAVTVHDLHAFETNLPWSNTPAHQAFRRRWAAMFGPIINRADCILVVSDFTRRRLVELLGAKDERIAVVGNGVDSAFFESPAEAEPAQCRGGRYLLVIGGLTWRKGGDLVLRAARMLQREVPDLRVVIAGTGDQEFDAPASELPNVIRLGFVDVAELVHLLRGATAMMFLSRYEGFGIPVAEAMAVGTPVIASRCGALPEVVGDAGLLVDAENTGEVAAAIKMLSSDSAARSELSARGRKRAEGWRWELCIERLLAALRER